MKFNDQIIAAIDEEAPRFVAAWFPHPTAKDVRLVRIAMHMGAVAAQRIRVDEMIENLYRRPNSMNENNKITDRLKILLDAEAERILKEQFAHPTEENRRIIQYAMYSAVVITSHELFRDLSNP